MKINDLKRLSDELNELGQELDLYAQKFEVEKYQKIKNQIVKAANEVGKAWSGSWFGYHSCIYYVGLKTPPPSAHFSIEWGLYDAFSNETSGDWREYDFDFVYNEILKRANSPDLLEIKNLSEETKQKLNNRQSEILSILETLLKSNDDNFLNKLLDNVEQIKVYSERDFIDAMSPSGKLFSRDSLALSQGLKPPPHICVLAEVEAIFSAKEACEKLAKIAPKAASHLRRVSKNKSREERIGTNIFIGHGQSKEWKELKDFIQDRLQLPWDEFNRKPIAGITNIARLSEMLDSAAFAFLVMTAEDEQADGSLQARMNVIHEAGLFQGRLGFNRAIVLLEEGCEEFSNIQGLGQIRFPKGNIKAVFEEIREVLERENIIEPEK